MNVFLWIVQAVLALFCFVGGSYKIFRSEDLVKLPVNRFLPRTGWQGLGMLEVSCAVLLILPGVLGWEPVLTVVGAAVIAVEDLALGVMFARRSFKLVASNPLTYVVVGAVLAGIVAVGRSGFTLSP